MRNCDGASTTFAPTGGGKYKCRICKQLFSQQGTKRHRNFHLEVIRHPEPKPGPVVTQEHHIREPMWKAHIRKYGFNYSFVHCPYCDQMHKGLLHPGLTVTCERCSRRFQLIE